MLFAGTLTAEARLTSHVGTIPKTFWAWSDRKTCRWKEGRFTADADDVPETRHVSHWELCSVTIDANDLYRAFRLELPCSLKTATEALEASLKTEENEAATEERRDRNADRWQTLSLIMADLGREGYLSPDNPKVLPDAVALRKAIEASPRWHPRTNPVFSERTLRQEARALFAKAFPDKS